MLRSLLEWGRRQPTRPVLFYNGDHDLLLVSRNRRRLVEHFDFVVAREELVEDLVDKERFSGLARLLELPVPSNVCLDPRDSTPTDIDVPFPMVIKPLMHRHEVWNPISGGAKALGVSDRKELEDLWPQLVDQGPVIAQQSIPGPESSIESYHVYVDADGNTVCEFTGRKIRTSPPRYGDTTALEITAEEDVLDAGRSVVERISLTGVAKLDFKRAPDGTLWLLEVNPRFNLWHHAGARAGANIPAAVYAGFRGGPPPPCTASPGATWCHLTRDARVARAAGISMSAWSRWAVRSSAKWALSAGDPMPFVRGVVARRLRSKFRGAEG